MVLCPTHPFEDHICMFVPQHSAKAVQVGSDRDMVHLLRLFFA